MFKKSRQCTLRCILLMMILATPAVCQEDITAFLNVQVIPMDRAGIIPNQTVIIEGHSIQAMGEAKQLIPPKGAKIIDGTGLYLTPGLTDAHVHLDNKIGARPDFGDAPLFLAYGVTTVFNLRGEPEHLEWKKRITAGTLLAPNLYNSGEFVNEPRINTPQEAEQEVAAHIIDGYDIIKFREVIDFEQHRILTTEGLGNPAYLRLNQAARDSNIPLVGHAPYKTGLSGLLQAGQSLAHMNELANLYFLPPLDLESGSWMKLTRWSLFILAGILVLWYVIGWKRRKELAELLHFRNISLQILLLAITAIILWILVVPPGFLFGNLWLLILLSFLVLVILLRVIQAIIRSVKIWRMPELPNYVKIGTLLLVLIFAALCISLIHWTTFAWRGSDWVIERVARDCRDAGIWIQTTLICQEGYMSIKEGYQREEVVKESTFRYLSEPMQESWRKFVDYPLPRTAFLWRRHPEFLRHLTHALHRQGVPLMAGTDAMGAPLIIPGISLHHELQLLLESGLSPAEVLWTATVGPARFLGKEQQFGTITVGKRADLLLLQGNPLDDLSHLQKLKGVMVRGKWLAQDKLQKMLETLAIAQENNGI